MDEDLIEARPVNYRGYRLYPTGEGWEIWHSAELVRETESATAAIVLIDGWLVAR